LIFKVSKVIGEIKMIIDKIFKGRKFITDTLIPYGFKKVENSYIFTKNILNDTFQVYVEFTNTGVLKVKAIDLSFHEEYVNYRIENQNGAFVNKVREELEKILIDIKNNCTIECYFLTRQANRIANLIIAKYKDFPDFAWQKFPGYGTFKNPDNGKWYALIMNINKSKIDTGDGEVEILDVKLDEKKIKDLLNRKGFYKAYHMNKNTWISILLDDTISDEEIIGYIEESHKFTEVNR